MLTPMIDTEGLKKRIKALSLQDIYFYQTWPNTGEAKIIGKAAFTLLYLYYSCKLQGSVISRSRKAFLAKPSVLAEESDEVLWGLALLRGASIIPWEKGKLLFPEASGWLFIFSANRRTTKVAF